MFVYLCVCVLFVFIDVYIWFLFIQVMKIRWIVRHLKVLYTSIWQLPAQVCCYCSRFFRLTHFSLKSSINICFHSLPDNTLQYLFWQKHFFLFVIFTHSVSVIICPRNQCPPYQPFHTDIGCANVAVIDRTYRNCWCQHDTSKPGVCSRWRPSCYCTWFVSVWITFLRLTE